MALGSSDTHRPIWFADEREMLSVGEPPVDRGICLGAGPIEGGQRRSEIDDDVLAEIGAVYDAGGRIRGAEEGAFIVERAQH